jgi:hypothetical protein
VNLKFSGRGKFRIAIITYDDFYCLVYSIVIDGFVDRWHPYFSEAGGGAGVAGSELVPEVCGLD